MQYVAEGGQNTPDNVWHDDYYFCEDAEVTIERDGKPFGLNRNPCEQFCKSVASKWRTHRDYLPDRVFQEGEREEQEDLVCRTLIECLHDGTDRAEIVHECFKALDALYPKPDNTKTLPREEYLWAPQRAFTATLFTGDLASVGCKPEDLTDDCEYGALTKGEREALARLSAVFEAIKGEHKFAAIEKWLCAQCYALNMPTDEAIKVVYGVMEGAGKKAKRSAEVKYSKHANEVFRWLLDAVKAHPEILSVVITK